MIKGQRCPFTETRYWLEEYKRVGGQRSELPNVMWAGRARSQLAKVTLAAALRAAFPTEEGATPTAEEMDGADITDAVTSDLADVPAGAAPESASDELIAAVDDVVLNAGDYVDDTEDPTPRDPEAARDKAELSAKTAAASEAEADAARPILLVRKKKGGGHEPWPEWATRFLKSVALVADQQTLDEWVLNNKGPLSVMAKEDHACHKSTLQALQKQRTSLGQDSGGGS